jgi:exo-1,4-beta-D-glucosaminidase
MVHFELGLDLPDRPRRPRQLASHVKIKRRAMQYSTNTRAAVAVPTSKAEFNTPEILVARPVRLKSRKSFPISAHCNPTPPRTGKQTPRSLWAIFLVFAIFVVPTIASGQSNRSRTDLRDNWALQSSCKISAKGAAISTPGFAADGWHKAAVPTTVLAALVADGTYPDPFFGNHLRSIPGGNYPLGADFALIDMPVNSPFRCSWWYRTEFTLAADRLHRYVGLHFQGINNRANIWFNGKRLADARSVAGADRMYEFDISSALHRDMPNALAVEVFPQTPRDLGITWIDWNPAPPDKDMGLWRDVFVESNGAVAIGDAQVVTHFPSASLNLADLAVQARVRNTTAQPVAGVLSGDIEGVSFEQQISLGANESRTVNFAPQKFPQLRIRDAKLWWPKQMGEPSLHILRMHFAVGDEISDEMTTRFGVREITSSIDPNGNRLFSINGKRLFIRGAGWAPDMLLRESSDRLRAQFRYIRDLNLNTVRLEGKLETEQFYNLADEEGVLVIAGWSCCDRWQEAKKWNARDLHIATESLRSQARRLRSHPSILAWLNGSDEGPPPYVENAFLATLKAADWPNPVLFSAAGEPSDITGATGVKMTGPYDYVPPDFWLADREGRNGGAAGFNTETGPGPAIPPKSSLEKMFGQDHLQPDDPAWSFHNALGTYSKLDHFDESMREAYGAPRDIDDYERKAQAMAYDSERAMFEAYSRNKYSSATGIVQWMLNNAWPSLFWHLYDYYLQPAGGYFGAKKALEPLHVQYSYDDCGVVVVNSTYSSASNLNIVATVYDQQMRQVYSREANVDAAADSVTRAMTIPQDALGSSSPVHFLRLTLTHQDRSPVSTNFYWLASKRNVFDWAKASYRYTPVSSYEDLKPLADLPMVHLDVTSTPTDSADGPKIEVRVKNPSSSLAFQVRLGMRGKGESSEILPVIWSDNYFELLPGESREITAQYFSATALANNPELVVSGWNVNELVMPAVPPFNELPR